MIYYVPFFLEILNADVFMSSVKGIGCPLFYLFVSFSSRGEICVSRKASKGGLYKAKFPLNEIREYLELTKRKLEGRRKG